MTIISVMERMRRETLKSVMIVLALLTNRLRLVQSSAKKNKSVTVARRNSRIFLSANLLIRIALVQLFQNETFYAKMDF